MNIRQGIGFKNSGRESCLSVIKLEQDDHRPWMTKPCRRPLRRIVVKRVVNFPDNSTLPVTSPAPLRPQITRLARNTTQNLGREALCHPPYSSDLAPLDYHLFHSLDNYLRGKSFTNETLVDFSASYTPEFYCKWIEQMEARWQKVLNADGTEVHVPMFRSGSQSDTKTSVEFPSQLGTYLSTQLWDKRLSRRCPTRDLNSRPAAWKCDTLPLTHWAS
ncbi:hypothetical protein TNCV_343721 [Trichonephila clavipes]|nr:hypothetical protein TNCV_343721 [Trichonephila clavipes]